MPTGLKSQKSKSINVVMTTEARQILDDMAEQRTAVNGTTYASDIVREAIEEYLARNGHCIQIKVDRGGYRERSAPE
jgi:predicted transcriptional regulator